MIELKERIEKYVALNDLEKIFYYIAENKGFTGREEDYYRIPVFVEKISPERGLTLEETLRKYRNFVEATVDNRYIPTEQYIPEGRMLYIRKFPRFMLQHEHYHRDALEIDMVLQGEFSQTIQGKVMKMKAGDVLFIAPNVHHTGRIYSETSVVFTVMIYQNVLRSLMNGIGAEDNILRTFLLRILFGNMYYSYLFCPSEFDPDLAGMMIDLEENQEETNAHIENYIEFGIQLFFLRLLVKHGNELVPGPEVAKRDFDVLNIMDYIETNFTWVTLGELARSYNYSPNHLSRLIKAQYGRNFNEILTDIKMRYATQLLLETDLSMTQIAEMAGFSEKSYFLKRFKQYHGMTTTQYKTRHQQSK